MQGYAHAVCSQSTFLVLKGNITFKKKPYHLSSLVEVDKHKNNNIDKWSSSSGVYTDTKFSITRKGAYIGGVKPGQ